VIDFRNKDFDEFPMRFLFIVDGWMMCWNNNNKIIIPLKWFALFEEIKID
jgi:hypothetical protein